MQQAHNQEFDYIISRALKTQDGRLALATLMVAPIRKALDYLGISRKILQVDYIPDGIFPIYEKDVDVVAHQVPARGALPRPQIEGDQVAVETFLIGVNPEIRRDVIRRRRYNVINRIQARTRATIQEEEDRYLFELLTTAAASNVYADVTFSGDITRDPLADAWAAMRKIDVFPTKLLINPAMAKGFLLWDRDDFDPITQHQVLKTGLFGKIWGIDIFLTKMCPENKFFFVTEPDMLGVIPIRQDVEVLDNPNNGELKLGWSIYEEIGFSILNNYGVLEAVRS